MERNCAGTEGPHGALHGRDGQDSPEEAQLLRQAADAKAPALSGELRSSSEVSSEKTRTQGTGRPSPTSTKRRPPCTRAFTTATTSRARRVSAWLENATNEFQTGFVQRVAAKLPRRNWGGS